MGILTGREIQRRVFEDIDDDERLYIAPNLDLKQDASYEKSSLDIRLGTHFIITRRTKFSHIDPFGLEGDREKTEAEIATELENYQEEVYIPFSEEFNLHPQQFAMGCTLEYFRFPLDVMAYVIGRSSWGRLGLVIAMATVVHPGYTGVLTLELENLGDAPITLLAGCRIGQLVFHRVEGKGYASFVDAYKVKYVAATKPSFSLIHKDAERKALIKYRRLAKEASKHLD